MREVTIVQRLLPHYRIDFFNSLHESLKEDNIKLQLVYGSSNEKESLKKDEVDLEWAIKIKNKTINVGPQKLYWQPCLKYIAKSEVVIVEQANKNIINYWLFITRLFTKQKIAFWGHGLNLQDSKRSFNNRIKKMFLTTSNWWFAYTSGVKSFLLSNRYPEKKITVVQNAINTTEIVNTINSISDAEMAELKNTLHLQSENIAIYCGGIYTEKRIPFLIESAEIVKKSIPDFHLIIVGSGEDVPILKKLIENISWIHYLGPKFGREKIALFKLSKVFLMPGLVGLAILDAFATQTPLITTDFPFHSPEIEYLENGINGLITPDNVQEYANKVMDLIQNDQLLHTLQLGCKLSTEKYTLNTMVKNFKEGIVNCLNS